LRACLRQNSAHRATGMIELAPLVGVANRPGRGVHHGFQLEGELLGVDAGGNIAECLSLACQFRKQSAPI